MRFKPFFVLLFMALSLSYVLADNYTKNQSTSIVLDQSYEVRLKPNQTKTWMLTLEDQPDPSNDLFITVQSPPNDPLQQPFLTIYTESQHLQECYSAANQFSGICRLDGSKLMSNMSIYIQAKCLVKCDLDLHATLNQRYVLSLDTTLYLRATQSTTAQYQFQLVVPSSLNFTQIAIFAQITDFSQVEGGLQFYANLGDKTIDYPTQKSFSVRSQPIFWGGEGLYFSKEDFKNGSYIKIYLILSAGTQIKLYSQVKNGNDVTIDLEKSYFDYASVKQPKKYYLDLSKKLQEIKGKNIIILFVVYGGNPTIQVAFDKDFKNTLQGIQNYGTMNFILTQSLRKSLKFQGTIFISVSSSIWNSDYFLSSTLFDNNYISIIPEISYYTEVLSKQVFNYFYDQSYYFDPNEQNLLTNRTYSIKIALMKGQGTFGVRRCKAAEKNDSPLSCIMTSVDDLTNQTILQDFYQIPIMIKKTEEFYQLLFDYDLSKCSLTQINNKTSAYYCFFHIVAVAKYNDLEYTLGLTQRGYASVLKEGQLIRDTIYKNQYVYYRFSLSSLQDIKEIAFYITLIEGEAALLASTVDSYPEFYSDDPDLKSSNSKRIIYQGKELAKNIYISVFGLQLSQFTIGVVVKREKKPQPGDQTKNNTIDVSKIKLHLGITQQFVLKRDQKAWFQVSSIQSSKVIIEIVQLVGNVEMTVYSEDQVPSSCLQTAKTSTKIACTLNITGGQSYTVAISGVQGDQQKIVIVYYKAGNCVPYSLNLPFYRELSETNTQCISYDISKPSDLELTVAASIAQLLHGDISLQICIKEKCRQASSKRHHQILKAQFDGVCNFTKGVSQSCFVQLNFNNISPDTIFFNLILAQKTVDIALFDGIAETVSSQQLSEFKAKNFYFEVNSNTTIRIFFTSFISNTYCILAHFIQEKQFVSSNKSIYISYQDKQNLNKSSYYQFYKQGAGTQLYPILADKDFCKNCMLTLSVYKLDSNTNSHNFSAFEVEVSQEETALVIGQSKTGFIEQDEIYVYQLQQPTSQDAIIIVRDLNKESSAQKNCFKLSIEDADSFTQVYLLTIPKNTKKLTVFVTTLSEFCQFQISYSFSGGSILEVSQGIKYNFQIDAKETAFFIFNHLTKSPFKIISILNTGEVQISVATLGQNQTWNELLIIDPLTYPLVGDASQGEIMVNTTSSVFCENCSYSIAVTSQKGAKGELLVTKINDTIPLSINGLIRQKIKVIQSKVRNYTFFSISTFNISINVIYGKVRVIVLNPQNEEIQNLLINTCQVIRVYHNKATENLTFESDSIYGTYKINVDTVLDSYFTIKASKMAISERIFQGIISYFDLQKNQPFVMEFLNLNKPQNDPPIFNVLIETIKVQDKSNQGQPTLNLTALYSEQDTNQLKIVWPVKKISSEGTTNVQFPLQKGDYYLNLTSDIQATVSVLLVKESLIHLKAESSVLMPSPGVFQLYSPFKSVMIEIFSCMGDLTIQATNDYSSFSSKKSSNEIVLQRSNYGGHYVISNSNAFGQYFIKVKSRGKQSNPILYLMNYYYYGQNDILPYKIVDQGSTSLSYSLNADSILFSIDTIQIKSQFKGYITNAQVVYYLYIDTQRSKVSKYANCRMQETIKIFIATKVTFESAQFKINFSDLQGLGKVYFVGAEAVVTIVPSPSMNEHYPKQLNFIYDVVEITNSKLPEIKAQESTGYSLKAIVLWSILPFGLAGLLLYFATKFFIKRYRMVPDHFIEEKQEEKQNGQSKQYNPASSKTKSAKSAPGSENFNQEIQ